MKVVSRVEFLKLPAGTVYCKGIRWAFEGPCVKGETCGNDWYLRSLNWIAAEDSHQGFSRMEQMLSEGMSFPLEDAYGRDGCFDEDVDAVFLIYETHDCDSLIAIATDGRAVSEE